MEIIKKHSGPSKCAKSLMLEKVKLRRMTEMKPPGRGEEDGGGWEGLGVGWGPRAWRRHGRAKMGANTQQ